MEIKARLISTENQLLAITEAGHLITINNATREILSQDKSEDFEKGLV